MTGAIARSGDMLRRVLRLVLETLGYRLIWLGKALKPDPAPPNRAEREARSERFHAAGGDVVLRLGYPLDAASLVFDVGGFEGRWAGDLHSRFGCRIEVFEPGERYAAVAERRFEHNGLVTVHRYGLGADDRMVEMAIDGVSSSAVMARPTDEREAIRLLDVANVMRDLAPSGVDLMKINIEGGEYACWIAYSKPD